MSDSTLSKVRADKWLWAARFFKTRSLAKKAIEGGKIHLGGQRIKPSKDLELDMLLTIRQGWDEKEVLILKLSDNRGPAPVAATLYAETEESARKREIKAQERKTHSGLTSPASKPNTRQRRHIHRFKRTISDLSE